MYIPDVDLHECATLEEASSLMKRHAPQARLLAGGTDILVDLKTGRLAATHLISLRRIESLRGITMTHAALRIGALVSITDLNRSPLVQRGFAALLDASQRMAAPPIRNVATIGGNLMSAVPCADLPPILMAMRAEVEVWSPKQVIEWPGATGGLSASARAPGATGGLSASAQAPGATGGLSASVRRAPLDTLFTEPRRTLLKEDEILIAVLVPKPRAGFGAAYERFGLREGNAIAVASVAAGLRLDREGTITDARLVLGAVAPIPKLAVEAGQSLIGRRPDDDAFQEAARLAQEASQPISDVRGTAQFRRHLVEVLTQRALVKARDRARETSL